MHVGVILCLPASIRYTSRLALHGGFFLFLCLFFNSEKQVIGQINMGFSALDITRSTVGCGVLEAFILA